MNRANLAHSTSSEQRFSDNSFADCSAVIQGPDEACAISAAITPGTFCIAAVAKQKSVKLIARMSFNAVRIVLNLCDELRQENWMNGCEIPFEKHKNQELLSPRCTSKAANALLVAGGHSPSQRQGNEDSCCCQAGQDCPTEAMRNLAVARQWLKSWRDQLGQASTVALPAQTSRIGLLFSF